MQGNLASAQPDAADGGLLRAVHEGGGDFGGGQLVEGFPSGEMAVDMHRHDVGSFAGLEAADTIGEAKRFMADQGIEVRL